MQTTNFQCGHCGNLMAVTANMLGQQVRCPTCQQVVLAPAPTPTAPPLPGIEALGLGSTAVVEPECIFSPPDASDEDLFGGPAVPQLQIPPPWTPPLEPTVAPVPPAPQQEEPLTYPPASQPAPADLGIAASPFPPPLAPTEPPAATEPPNPFAPAGETELAPEVFAEASRPTPRPARRGSSWVVPVLIIPLISYSAMVTALLLWQIYKPPPPHPLEMIPDLSDHPSTKLEKKVVVYDYKQTPTYELPDKLRVPLGQPLAIGAVRVTPRKVEFGKIKIRTQNFSKVEESPYPTLILHLDFENISEDVAFRPLDAFFNPRLDHSKGNVLTNRTFTQLVMGNTRLCGGPCKWVHPAYRGKELVETVEGQHYEKELKPGDPPLSTFVCVDPDTQDPTYLATHPEEDILHYKGPLLYRVQVRRGLVNFKGKDVPCTAVIGVEFTDRDIEKPG
jgi:hypothetical protein